MEVDEGPSSVGGLLALLDEPDVDLRLFALHSLTRYVDEFWAEISAFLPRIESVYEEETRFPEMRSLAALLASKLHYHLGEISTSVTFALGAGSFFNPKDDTEFAGTLVAHCFDTYVVHERVVKIEGNEAEPLDPRLISIVEDMFDRCLQDGFYREALGIALESARLDVAERAIEMSGNRRGLLRYCFDQAMSAVANRKYRRELLNLLIRLHYATPPAERDYFELCLVLTALDDPQSVAPILKKLVRSGAENDELIAYQICFDLAESGTQQFLRTLRSLINGRDTGDGEEVMEGSSLEGEPEHESDDVVERSERIREILTRKPTLMLQLRFLFKNDRTDALILQQMKASVESLRSTIYSTGVIYANAIMHAGTAADQFLRSNAEWMRKLKQWAQFASVSSLGIIHRGHHVESRELLSAYLPRADGAPGAAPFKESGAMYALGLIHANHGLDTDIVPYLLDLLIKCAATQQAETLQHGACLGLGLAAMGAQDEELQGHLRNVLVADAAVSGDTAAIGIGLVRMGSADPEVIEMLIAQAKKTSHERIIRGCALALALVMYRREEGADALVARLFDSADPILRYGGALTIGLAYLGTASRRAMHQLLHVAVSDVSDDVRRIAVMSQAFLLHNHPEEAPKALSLLSESYNPHVRYGAALAVGVSCAGTGMKAAVDLIDPLTKDSVDFVRQAAYIGMAMVYMLRSDAQSPQAVVFRKHLLEVMGDRHEDLTTRMGAIIAGGLIDGGGRNCALSLSSWGGRRADAPNASAVAGLLLFFQMWYWYPFALGVGLALSPRCVIGVDGELRMPEFSFVSNAPSGLFEYPTPWELPKKETRVRGKVAALSTTQRDLDLRRKREKAKVGREKEEKPTEEVEAKKEVEKKKEKEKPFSILKSPARVVPEQTAFLSFEGADQRWVPIKSACDVAGISLVRDTQPDLPRSFLSETLEEAEPVPPPAFDYDEELEDRED